MGKELPVKCTDHFFVETLPHNARDISNVATNSNSDESEASEKGSCLKMISINTANGIEAIVTNLGKFFGAYIAHAMPIEKKSGHLRLNVKVQAP